MGYDYEYNYNTTYIISQLELINDSVHMFL